MSDRMERGKRLKNRLSAYLSDYVRADMARFHMPGHKGRGTAYQDAARRDITEIAGADNLLHPTGILRDAQESTAAFYGARKTWFTTGGATAAILAATLSLPQNTLLFVPRNAHKSVVSALTLSGHDAVFFSPVYGEDERFEPLSCELLRAVIQPYEDRPCALWLVRPDYYGRCADVQAIAALCNEKDIVLLVDEAHGAHFAISGELPAHAVPYADIVINSAHKTLDAPNQAAYLHAGKARHTGTPELTCLERNLALIQTSSPSYPHLEALGQAWRDQKDAWEIHIERLYRWSMTLPAQWQIALRSGWGGEGVAAFDPTRLCIDTAVCGWSGYEPENALLLRNVVMEMADARRIVGITSPLDEPEWYDWLRSSLISLRPKEVSPTRKKNLPPTPQTVFRVREVMHKRAEIVEFDQAEGRICAQSVGVYPPGAAVVMPGERFDREILAWLAESNRAGSEIFGVPLLCVVE